MTGVNLGRWRHPRWSVFANGFYESTTIRGLGGHLLTLGSHVQYQAVQHVRRGALRWTGVALTTGLEYSNWAIGEVMGTPIDSHFTAEGNDGGVVERYTIHMFSTGTLDVTSTTLTVPVEVTTGVRAGPIALYGGLGVDMTAGSSQIVAQLDSTLTYTAERIPIGNAVIIGSGENGPTALTMHGLLGLAVHTRRVRVFAQTALAPGDQRRDRNARLVLSGDRLAHGRASKLGVKPPRRRRRQDRKRVFLEKFSSGLGVCGVLALIFFAAPTTRVAISRPI